MCLGAPFLVIFVGCIPQPQAWSSSTIFKLFLNIGSGENVTINTIANLIGSKTIHVDPVNEPHANLANISKAKDLLGRKPSVKVEDWLKDLKIN